IEMSAICVYPGISQNRLRPPGNLRVFSRDGMPFLKAKKKFDTYWEHGIRENCVQHCFGVFACWIEMSAICVYPGISQNRLRPPEPKGFLKKVCPSLKLRKNLIHTGSMVLGRIA